MATEVETKEPISESPSGGAAAAIDKSSISNETAKDEALCTVAVGTLDSSKGEILVEAPKETVSKHGEIVSEELKNEGDLTNNGNNTEAKGEKVTAAKELAESESSDVNVMAIDKERATDESASQNRLQQKDQDQDDNIVHAQVTVFDMVEASEAQAEDKEDEGTTDIEKLEVNGDNIKREAENGILSDESTSGVYNTPAAETFEKKNSKEPLEIMNEDLEPTDKFESPIGAVLEEPDAEKFERVNEVAEPSEEGCTQESLGKTSKEALEPAEGEHEHDKPESFQEPEEENKIEAETEICADKRIDDADGMSVAEPSDKEIEQEPPEITAKDGPEPAKEEPEHGKLESSHDAIPDEQEERELETVDEDMNVNAEAENGTCDDERTNEFEPEHEKFENYLDAVTGEPEVELETVNEDERIKIEAETEICADERTTDAGRTSVTEPYENENRQEPIDIMVKEAHEPAEEVPEHSERESTLVAVLEKPEASMLLNNDPEPCGLKRNHENEPTSKEDLVMNVEECSVEDDKEYEPFEKETLNSLPEYESTSIEAAAATDTSSISHETAKDDDLCTVAVGTLDSSEGEIIVEAPKETVLKYVEIVSEELKNGRELTSNGDNTEAKDEKVIAAKELAESENSDVNVMAIDEERATDESASQDSLHQKDRDDNIVHAQASEAREKDKEDEGATDIEKLEVNGDNINKEAGNGMLSDESTNGIDNTPTVEPLEMKNTKEPHENKDIEPADKLESSIDAVREEPDVEQLERVYEDKHVKVEAETGIFNDERTNGIDCVSVEEPSEKGNMQESHEKSSKEELEAAKDEPEHDKLKSFPEPKVEKLGRVNEDNVKIEGEPEVCADERIDDADSMSVAESSDKEIKQEPLEITAKEDPELAKDEPEHGKLESSLDPVAHELEEKELERVYEDMNAKVEAENGICDDKRSTGTDSISEAEPSDKENRQETLEMTAEENLEPEKDEPEHEKLEKSLDAITREPEKKLGRVIEDKKIKMEAETEICDDERTADADSTPVLEPSEKENRQEPIEITAKEDLEPVEDVPEHSEPESSLDAVLQKPEASMLPDNGPETSGLNRNHENETMSKEDLVMTLEECSAEDEKKYEPIEEPIEKKAVNFQPEYENSMTELGAETAMANGTVTDSKFNEKNEDTVDDFTVTQEIILETIKGVEMHETAISEELIHDADDNIEQIRREIEAENLTKISETAAFKDQSNNKIADAETTNFISDDCANQKKELDTLCTSEVSVEENIENVIDAEKSTEQSSEKVDDNESNERCTQGIHELEIENAIHDSIEDTDNMDNIFKAEQTSKKITGVSLNTEQMGNEKVNEGSEVNQQKDPSEEVVDIVISSDESSTEQGPNHDPTEGSGEDHLKIDTIRCEKIIITEHNAFADDIEEKNHVDKQENFKKMDEVASVLEGTTANADNSSCKADDRDEKVRDDNNRNDGGEELEDASNLICENQAHETVNGEGNIEVISSNEKTSKEFELVSELVPELKSQETRTETEGTPIEKSNFDENSCHKNIKTSNLTKETEPANEESGTSNNDVLEETIDEDNQEGTITSSEELDESGTKKANEYEDGELKDKVTVSDNSVSDIPALDEVTGQVESAHQKAADPSCEEHIHESISISEGANLDAFIIENKTEQKSYESNGESESNENVSFNETAANDSEKEKLEDSEPEKSTHAVLEDLEITIGAEGIHESETNKESTKNNNEENFLKDRDMKLVESAIELEPDHQNNKSIYPTEGASPSEEALNVKDLVDDIAKEEAHNEEKHCGDDDVSVAHNLVEESTDMEGEEPHLQKERMELETHGKTEQNECIVAQNEEIAEKSETIKLHKDTKELIKQSSNTLLGSQEIATPIKNIEKNIMPDEDAAEADLEQIPDDETEAKENSEQVTDIVPNDEVKEDDHQTSEELVMDSTENLITSTNTVFQAEETKQGVGEQFSKISDYWPRGYNEEASMVNTVDAEHPKETMGVVEQPEAEQITHTSTDSTAACETEEQGEEVYLPEDSGLDTIYKEGREELKEVTDSMPKEVDKKIGSSVELTEDRENPHDESAVQESQVDQPDIVTETEELTDKAGHEVEVANLQEEKQQTGLGHLPVSQFLMKYILQEEGDILNEAHDGENEDVSNKQNDGDKRNEGKIPKQEDKSAPHSVVQLIEETSTPEDKVGSKKLEDSSESVQAEEGYEGKVNSDITVFKDGPSLQSTPDESASSLVVTEDGKDEVGTLSSEMSNNIARDESLEVNSTEQNSQGSAVDNEHCKPDLVQDEKIKGTVLEETLTQEEIQKDNETHDKEVDVSTFGKTSEEDNLQKERGEESKVCLQDVVKAEGSYEVSDGQSTMEDDSEHGEILEIKSEIEKVECGDEKQEVGNQVQILKNDSTEELTLSEPQIIQQIDIVNEAKIHALETAEKFMEDKNSANSLDRKQVVEAKVDENKADEEKHEKEEKEEFKPEKFSSNAAIVETKESELKPVQKCEQTRKSSESTTTEGHELEETLHLHSEVKIVESGEKKQDAVNQNQVQMNKGLNEEEKLSDSATQPLHMAEKLEEQSSVANVDENHAVQTTETKVDENKAGDEKEEEEEDEHDPEESGQNSTINVESRDAELKPAPKKSHGILSGVGSKVKHSIAKVKKAITGKSSHSKTVSAK